MPTRVLIVGAGGREHAIAWKLASEPGINAVYVAPGSAAMEAEARVTALPGVDPLDAESVTAAARKVAAELVVIGPEAPLAAGVADALRLAGFAVFGPGRGAARIESSKAFCHDVARAAGIRMPRFGSFADPAAAAAFARTLAADGHGVVVKADGLAAGKGVTVADDVEAALAAIDLLALDASGAEPFVVIEERLRGPEASLIAIADGRDVLAMPLARDHKRLLDGDAGPNTGGMGAFSPLPDLDDGAVEGLLDAFHRPLLAELARRGSPFIGALYAGLMLTDDGPVLLECNARFGDPETQAIMPRLAGPIGPLLLAAAGRGLRAAATAAGIRGSVLPTLPGSAVAIVLASAGYPDAVRRGEPISGLDAVIAGGDLVFHAGTRRDDAGRYLTNGGRVVAVVGRGDDLAAAAHRADAAAALVSFRGAQRRTDIARASIAPPEIVPPGIAAPASAGAAGVAGGAR
ncbi:MAG: phosphoribosylamine--glycine ligase [Chloroflexota bacterium]|nr:MAG: phosphoribosylamine--glycine ligase [Chloroflexota bacterium]